MSKVEKEFPIIGMSCGGCAANIERSLLKEDYVEKASVSISTEKAIVEYEDSKHGEKDIVALIENLGYKVPGSIRSEKNA